MAALEARGMEAPDGEAWGRLESVAQGSVRRVLQLLAAGGLELDDRIEKLMGSLPRLDWQLAHALTDDDGIWRTRRALRDFLRVAAR